jgi:hypothetical protein
LRPPCAASVWLARCCLVPEAQTPSLPGLQPPPNPPPVALRASSARCLQHPTKTQKHTTTTTPALLCPPLQHILAAFRSQKVEKVLFDLNTARARATVTLHCENGAAAAAPRSCPSLPSARGGGYHIVCAHSQSCVRSPVCPPLSCPVSRSSPAASLASFSLLLPAAAGLVKTYKLPTLASEILQASVDKQQFAVRLTAEAAAMSRLLSSFHSGLEEVTLVALPDGTDRPVHINSFIDPQKGEASSRSAARLRVRVCAREGGGGARRSFCPLPPPPGFHLPTPSPPPRLAACEALVQLTRCACCCASPPHPLCRRSGQGALHLRSG